MEEARKLHKEMQRLRVLISYQEAKYRRIRKIKSKKYHRIMRKDKLKKAVDEFDDLVAGNHEKAAEKLDELDRLRALERASLKHMNTGKWAKHHRIRAKYNEQSRNDLNEQLKISKEMMQKRTATTLIDDDGDDDSEESIAIDEQSNENESNKISLEMITQQPYNYCPWSSKLLQKQKNSTFIEQQLVDDDNDDDVIENEHLPEIRCDSDALPEATYRWISNSFYDKFTGVIADTPILALNRTIQRDSAGTYTCIASNRHGEKRIDLQINVLCK